MTAEELLQRHATGERDFSGVDLSEVDLTGADLRGINLSQANLTLARMYRVNLEGANLSQARLGGVLLGGSKVSHANLRDITCDAEHFAAMTEVDFTGTDFTGADFDSHADLTGSNFKDAILMWESSPVCEWGNFHNTILDDGTLFVGPSRRD